MYLIPFIFPSKLPKVCSNLDRNDLFLWILDMFIRNVVMRLKPEHRCQVPRFQLETPDLEPNLQLSSRASKISNRTGNCDIHFSYFTQLLYFFIKELVKTWGSYYSRKFERLQVSSFKMGGPLIHDINLNTPNYGTTKV